MKGKQYATIDSQGEKIVTALFIGKKDNQEVLLVVGAFVRIFHQNGSNAS